MDDIDRAGEQAQFHLDREIARVRSKARTGVYRNRKLGECLFCEERIEDDKAFCDSDCKEDYEKQERVRQHRRV